MPVLRVLNGVLEGKDVEIDADEIVIGKEGDCAIVLADPGVSRRHAKIIRRNGTFLVEDSGSANGTFVNFTRKKAGEATPLNDRDVLFIGRTVVKFFAERPTEDEGGGEAAGGGGEEVERLKAELDDARREIDELRAAGGGEAGGGEAGSGGGGGLPPEVTEESLRTLLRGTIPIHGLTCPKCATDLEEPFRARVREREQLEVVRRLKLHKLEPKDLQTLLEKARS